MKDNLNKRGCRVSLGRVKDTINVRHKILTNRVFKALDYQTHHRNLVFETITSRGTRKSIPGDVILQVAKNVVYGITRQTFERSYEVIDSD